MMAIKRIIKCGEIYWVDFGELEDKDKSSETEINGKGKPIVVISIDWYNNERTRAAVLPMSSKVKNIRVFELFLGKVVIDDPKSKESKVLVDQIRSIDKDRLGEKGGELTPEQMKKFLVLTDKIKAKL